MRKYVQYVLQTCTRWVWWATDNKNYDCEGCARDAHVWHLTPIARLLTVSDLILSTWHHIGTHSCPSMLVLKSQGMLATVVFILCERNLLFPGIRTSRRYQCPCVGRYSSSFVPFIQ